jgi:hypothetical protein
MSSLLNAEHRRHVDALELSGNNCIRFAPDAGGQADRPISLRGIVRTYMIRQSVAMEQSDHDLRDRKYGYAFVQGCSDVGGAAHKRPAPSTS